MSDSISSAEDSEDPEAAAFLAKMNEIFEIFRSRNSPAAAVESADVFLTTDDVFSSLQSIYPSDTYTAETAYQLMQAGGFKQMQIGDTAAPYYWLIKTVSFL